MFLPQSNSVLNINNVLAWNRLVCYLINTDDKEQIPTLTYTWKLFNYYRRRWANRVNDCMKWLLTTHTHQETLIGGSAGILWVCLASFHGAFDGGNDNGIRHLCIGSQQQRSQAANNERCTCSVNHIQRPYNPWLHITQRFLHNKHLLTCKSATSTHSKNSLKWISVLYYSNDLDLQYILLPMYVCMLYFLLFSLLL